MEYQKETNGRQTLWENWWFLPLPLSVLAANFVLSFFENLTGMPWIRFFVVSEVLLFSGAALIVYAKMPLYRSGRFFTFGVKSIPQGLKGFYRWGWRVFLFGVVLSLCLLLSNG
jgi:hypothetical protein